MANLLAQRIEETLRPVIGTVLAAVSVDVETTSLDPMQAELCGVSLALEAGRAQSRWGAFR